MTALELPPTDVSSTPGVRTSAAHSVLPGQRPSGVQAASAGEAQTTRSTNGAPLPAVTASGGYNVPHEPAALKVDPSVGDQHGRDQMSGGTQSTTVAVDSRDTQGPGSRDTQSAHALGDPLLYLAAASLDDLERTRIAAENRLRQLTRNIEDADGEERGFGLTADNPQVRAQQSVVDGLAALEHGAELALIRRLRTHPLWPWIKGTVGVGPKQGARLLAAIGDPYMNTLHNRPRTVSELWSYCGYRVVPAGHPRFDTQQPDASGPQDIPADHRSPDTQRGAVGGEQQDGDPGHLDSDTQAVPAGVAVRRRKGQRANWSTVAKMRAFLVAESCIKQARSPYRAVYDDRRAHTAVTRPEWTPGHSHNDALRVVAKEVLKDLWRVARDVHDQSGGQSSRDAQRTLAAGPQHEMDRS